MAEAALVSAERTEGAVAEVVSKAQAGDQCARSGQAMDRNHLFAYQLHSFAPLYEKFHPSYRLPRDGKAVNTYSEILELYREVTRLPGFSRGEVLSLAKKIANRIVRFHTESYRVAAEGIQEAALYEK
ncbi:hypothetical protein [Nocardia brasiliensis]|uniref:hypothetical protein n=1 Tax=Nocardia brasiliensis TaxID=37326 RepID=UPI002457DD97|nr:hypothetical protein [Nocardia brasiliensis]